MAIDGAQVKAFANAFVPFFYFDSGETIFPVSAESWLQQCAAGDWSDPTDPHAGTTVIAASLPLTSPKDFFTSGGCAGSSGEPLSTAQRLPIPDAFKDGYELFLDFAGWESLKNGTGLTAGNDAFIQAFYESWFSQLNVELSSEGGSAPQRPGTTDPVPTQLMLYCEGAWAGEYTRLCIAQGCNDFASATTKDASDRQPDPALDPFFVLTYYLFYPCTEPPPGTAASQNAPITNKREGQWEAVSFYFNAAPVNSPVAGSVVTPANLTLPQSATGVIPAYVVMSQGVLASGDGTDTAGLSANYPAQANTQTSPPSSVSGTFLTGGGLPVYVTGGTHKNLFGETPFASSSDPNQGGLVAGNVAVGVGAGVAGAGVGALGTAAGITTAAGAVNFWNPLGWILLIIGLIILIIGAIVSAEAAGQTSSSPLPNPAGDTADGGGTAVGGPTSVGQSTSQSPIQTNLTIFTTPTLSPDLPPPAWWSFPGRWGVAMAPGATGWDSGAYLTDFRGRTRGYWNTCVLQVALAS
jgi:hypothetical protein